MSNDTPILPSQELCDLTQCSLGVPIRYAQISTPRLLRFSNTEIQKAWKNILSNPKNFLPVMKYSESIPYDRSFDAEEDFYILKFVKGNPTDDPLLLMNKYNGHIRPFHTKQELINHMRQIRINPNSEAIALEYAKLISMEELVAHSCETPNRSSRCIDVERRFTPHPLIDDEIEKGSRLLSTYSNYLFESIPKVLAILRGETVEYRIKNTAVLIGRSCGCKTVDIDLGFIMDASCPHISRKQALLTFMDDYKFYLENVGSRTFRVNGALIKTNQICQIQEGDILDFSDNLLMFLPNNQLIEKLMH